jgi:hypothetical protein
LARHSKLVLSSSSDEDEAQEARTEKVGEGKEDFVVVRKEGIAKPLWTESEEEDELPVRKAAPRKRSRVEAESADDDEDDLPVRRRVRAGKADDESDDGDDGDTELSEDEESAPVRTPRARKSKPGKKTPSRREEEEDLEEDMAMIRESSPPPPSSILRAKSSARKDALAQLQRDRARRSKGEWPSRVISDDDEEETNDPGDALPYDEDENEDDFVVEDGPLGAPLNDIPIEFTRWASAKPKELFRHAVDFLVQARLNPAFPAGDDIYRVAWQKLDDQVQGLVGSKFSSAAWTRDFHVALHARPAKVTAAMAGWDEHCQACNRSGHTATRSIQFLGAPYARGSLEELEQDERDEEDGIVRDGQGRVVPPEATVYVVGKQCFKNAVAAHTLEHWRRDLRDEVWKRLEALGELAPERIVERDGLGAKRRREYANAVVDRMEVEGMVRELYQIYKDTIEDARNSDVSFWLYDTVLANDE